MELQGAPPSYVRETQNLHLVESFTGLHVQPAPQYEPPPIPITLAPTPPRPPRIIQQAYKFRGTLAERCAACYFRYTLRRHHAPSLQQVIAGYHADLSSSRVRRALTSTNPDWRGLQLRRLVNATIDAVVVPELARRAEETARIQQALSQNSTEAIAQQRKEALRAQELEEYNRIALFGDLWTGTREQAIDVGTMHEDLYTRMHLESYAIAGKMQTTQHDRDFALLQTRCLTRMQDSWRNLLRHCDIQLELVRLRGQTGGPILAALMSFEEHKMERALAALKEEFTQCVMQKTQLFPPLRSFHDTFAPMCGSALRAARQVMDEDARGFVYDADFLNQNRLFEHGSNFFSRMKDHLHCLMIREGLKRKAYLAQREAEIEQHREARRLQKEIEKDTGRAPLGKERGGSSSKS
ncbi:hypothetical protein BCR37DRAFT_393733 [Protomyces lactucae-debilis]|uniref:Uncharacterized protein n=1 Tax=Protomyces lactucae-debilis TaxID=2754530 RepID=A0A1Y2F902_PROLT|nr:uncharacterized protein BCR37DRAFT_393733 [Protomyces lactucae-debilis]ORY80369.1 hypothetical protein BCR37DRAFT_393733 [Protomyces lactucae-debilis]